MPRAQRWCLRSLAVLAVAWLVGCSNGDADPTAAETPTATIEAPASTTPDATASVTSPLAEETVDAALVEVLDAVRAAEDVIDALDEADEEGAWDPVTAACQRYPALPPNPGSSLASISGLWTQAQQPALWPTAVVELDETTATACFLVAAAQEIPPDARIDAEAPTTAEIVARPIEAALETIEQRDEAGLRTLIEEHS